MDVQGRPTKIPLLLAEILRFGQILHYLRLCLEQGVVHLLRFSRSCDDACKVLVLGGVHT